MGLCSKMYRLRGFLALSCEALRCFPPSIHCVPAASCPTDSPPWHEREVSDVASSLWVRFRPPAASSHPNFQTWVVNTMFVFLLRNAERCQQCVFGGSKSYKLIWLMNTQPPPSLQGEMSKFLIKQKKYSFWQSKVAILMLAACLFFSLVSSVLEGFTNFTL